MNNHVRDWTCDYCGRSEAQTGPRAMHLPPVPPEGWLRVMTSKHGWTAPAEGRKRSEEIRTEILDACPGCAVSIERALQRQRSTTPG
jgi:hypothetical protein